MIPKVTKDLLVKNSETTHRYTKLDGIESYLEIYSAEDDCVAEVWLEDALTDPDKLKALATAVDDWISGSFNDPDQLLGYLEDHEIELS